MRGMRTLERLGIRRRKSALGPGALVALVTTGAVAGVAAVLAFVPKARAALSKKAPRDRLEKPAQGGQENEGEGSRTAARRYDEATMEFVRQGKVAPAAQAALRAIEGSEATELRRAEEAGKHPRTS